MKRSKLIFFVVSLSVLGFFGLSKNAGADEIHLTPNQLDYIKASCEATEVSLSQLHSNDALSRVNLGQSYEAISTRLIKRFNSRVAYNNLNNSSLVAVSNEYDKSLNLFRNSYQEYEVSLSNLISIDCQNNPEQFFGKLESTRTKRLLVRENVDNVNTQLKNYSIEVNNFETNFQTLAGKNGN